MGVSRLWVVSTGCVASLLTANACTPSEARVAETAAEAQRLLEAGQVGDADKLINRAVRQRDDMPVVFLVQARIALASGNEGKAFDAFSNALALDTANPTALLGVAQTGIASGHVQEAEAAAEKIEILSPGQPDAVLVEGVASLIRNDLNGSIARADKVLAIRPQDPVASILKARALERRGDREGALRTVRASMARHGQTLALTATLVELMREDAVPGDVLPLLRHIRQFAPQQRTYRFDLIDVLYRLGRIDEARAEALSLIEDSVEDPGLLDGYARLWRAYDVQALTADQIAQAAAKAPVATRLAVARFLVSTGRGAAAAILLRPIATGWSSDVQALYARAVQATSGAAAGRTAGGTTMLRDPGNGDLLLSQARAAVNRGDAATAIRAYQQVMHDYPQWEEGYLGLASVYAAMHRPEAVRRTLRNGSEAMPQSLLIARRHVQTLLRMGDGEAARGVARQFAHQSPSLSAGWLLYEATCEGAADSGCRPDAAAGLARARKRFGLDPVPGAPKRSGLSGRMT